MAIKVLSLNTRGLSNTFKRKSLFQFLKKEKYDIVCLQETHVTKNNSELWSRQWSGQFFSSPGTSHGKGQIILINKFSKVSDCKIVVESDRVLGVKVTIENQNIMIFNVYGPNKEEEKESFFKQITKLVQEIAPNINNYVIAGDFNTVASNEVDIIAGNKHRPNTVKMFNNAMIQWETYDVWRLFHDGEKQFTWCKHNPFIARRLDYVLISSRLFDKVTCCDIVVVPNTDHRGVVMELKLDEVCRGPSYWKFNDFLLKDPEYIAMINDLLDHHLNAHESFDERLKWDFCKIKIREATIAYCKAKAKERHNHIYDIRKQLESIDKKLALSPQDIDLISDAKKLQMKLDLASIDESKGAQIRARVKWAEHGEKNSKYFLGLERGRACSKTITSLSDPNGGYIHDQKDIHKQIINHYKKLYSSKFDFSHKEKSFDEFISDLVIPQITEDDKQKCDEVIALQELGAALKELNNSSAPGHDGLTASFYKLFWAKIGPAVYASFNRAFETGQLSQSQRRGIIIQLHKGKNLPRHLLDNWRGITLTNTDYKILAKALAMRLQGVIKNVVNEDQVGYIKGRNISTIIRLIDDVIEMIRFNHSTGGILALDYCKAFDTINKGFLLKSFESFGFGTEFRKWVNVLMADNYSSVQHCGWLSHWFPTDCGIRQGCPFSPLSFILAVEILALKIRQCGEIRGIILPGADQESALKIAQLADDTSTFVSDTNDIRAVLKIVNMFSDFSGLIINYKKSKGLWVGNEPENGLPTNIQWATGDETIKILGVYFSANKPASEISANWESKMLSISNTIRQWDKRGLSIMGKVVLAKTFLLSRLVYLMQGLVIPHVILKKIDAILYKFLWKKKVSEKKAFEKVKRAVINAEYERGGLKMISAVDMQNSFQIAWVKKLILDNGAKWTAIPAYEYGKFGSNFSVFKSSVEVKHFKGINMVHSTFWQSVLHCWIANNSIDILSHMDVAVGFIEDQNLWNNECIKFKGNPVFYPEWANAGIHKLGDMFNDDGDFLSYPDICEIVGNSASRLFQYNAVYNAIPETWREKTTAMQFQEPPKFWDTYITGLKSNTIRALLVNNKYSRPCSAAFWERKFNILFDNKIWSATYQATKETRLLALQWKIIHNIYPTNILLSKMKIRDNKMCSFCPQEIDYIEHFLFDCRICQPLWLHIENILCVLLETRLHLDTKQVLFGIWDGSEFSRVQQNLINLCLIIGKMCISKYKYGTPMHIQLMFDREFTLRKSQVPPRFHSYFEQ